ncbi:unnamed protein product [Litomosoides sigmodontis]|uniref:G-protein coupled receptors family 1 profile domain-containing protein n=1 Tax=Litomosoides sigmodontis TaxID=42156 RepID=A0A3P6SPJ0_LITSI|nr:unnamed protein product [Litomosoides sigmodontis]
MWQSYVLWSLYLLTMKIGIIGNLWVICSVVRNPRPQTYGWLQRPSDYLRSYIFVLALADFFVVCELALRLLFIWNETITFEIWNCRGLYLAEQLSKMVSMFCLAAISIGRYIAICNPFLKRSQIRKHFYQGFSVVTLLLFFLSFIPILLTVRTISVTADKRDCLIASDSAWNRLTGLLVGMSFILLLLLTCSLVLISVRAINQVGDKHDWMLWIPILANWLTYLNSALNWIFYAMLNRDLRELIRSNTKRRKRSTMMCYHHSSSRSSRQRLYRSLSIHVLAESLFLTDFNHQKPVVLKSKASPNYVQNIGHSCSALVIATMIVAEEVDGKALDSFLST